MDDANDNLADTSASEYAKAYNLPNEQVGATSPESKPQELQSIRNKLFDYKIKKAEFVKKQAEQVKLAPEPVAPQKVYTQEEAAKQVTDTGNKDSNENNVASQASPEKQNVSPAQTFETTDPAKERPGAEPSTQAEQEKLNNPNINSEEMATTAAIASPIQSAPVVTQQSTPSADKSTPVAPNTMKSSEQLKQAPAYEIGAPQPYDATGNAFEKSNIPINTSDSLVGGTRPAQQNITSPENATTTGGEQNKKIESIPPVINNIITASPPSQSAVPTQPQSYEPTTSVTISPVVPEVTTGNQGIPPKGPVKPDNNASKMQEPASMNMPTPEQPGFAEMYTKNLRALIDNFAVSMSQAANPTEASLNSIQVTMEGLVRESTANTKQMVGMVNRLCSVAENILRYLPNMNAGGAVSVVAPQPAQSYNSINTGLIDDTRNSFRKQYESGSAGVATNRPTIPGFSI